MTLTLQLVITALIIIAAVPALTIAGLKYGPRILDTVRGGRRSSADTAPADISAPDALCEILTALQCPFRSHKTDDGDTFFTFSFQGGHFIASISKTEDIDLCSISFFHCARVTVDESAIATRTCNQINCYKLPLKCVVAPDDDPSYLNFDIHCTGIRLIPDKTGTETVAAMLRCCFDARRIIEQELERQRGEEPGDLYLNRAPYAKAIYAMAHAELEHTPARWSNPWWQTPDMSLGALFRSLTGRSISDSATIYIDSIPAAGTSPDDIDVFSRLLPVDGGEGQRPAMMVSVMESTDGSRRNTYLTFTLRSIEERLYLVNIDAVSPGLPVTPYRPIGSAETMPEVHSTTVGIHRGGPELYKAEAEYMAAEEGLVSRCVDSDAAYSLYWGRTLYAAGRYLEATHYLLNAYSRMAPTVDSSLRNGDNTGAETFFELCFFLSASYYAMQQYSSAYFYIDIISSMNRMRWTQLQMLIMMQLRDPRLPSMLQNASESLAKQRDEEENTDTAEAITEMLDFIGRQKIVLDIRDGNTDRARTALTEMLAADPDSAFALHWLAKIGPATPTDTD